MEVRQLVKGHGWVALHIKKDIKHEYKGSKGINEERTVTLKWVREGMVDEEIQGRVKNIKEVSKI